MGDQRSEDSRHEVQADPESQTEERAGACKGLGLAARPKEGLAAECTRVREDC